LDCQAAVDQSPRIAVLYDGFFRVYREDVFTTKDTARRSRNQSRKDVFTTKVTKDTKGSDDQISELRALRDLRGELDFLIAGDYLVNKTN
jgi:hypothetical protein